mmetsp:Transcript_59601/g.130886  ORF Transcript_59601/g.130886 Transcript_59601/m.130886 type:complete len:97 (-) Transcript_59601:1593-1883(-)
MASKPLENVPKQGLKEREVHKAMVTAYPTCESSMWEFAHSKSGARLLATCFLEFLEFSEFDVRMAEIRRLGLGDWPTKPVDPPDDTLTKAEPVEAQ